MNIKLEKLYTFKKLFQYLHINNKYNIFSLNLLNYI